MDVEATNLLSFAHGHAPRYLLYHKSEIDFAIQCIKRSLLYCNQESEDQNRSVPEQLEKSKTRSVPKIEISTIWTSTKLLGPSIFEKTNTTHQDQNFSENLDFKNHGPTWPWPERTENLESYQDFGLEIRDRSVLHCFRALIFCVLTRPCGFPPDFQLISSPWRKPGVTTPKTVWNKSIHNFISIQILKNEFDSLLFSN